MSTRLLVGTYEEDRGLWALSLDLNNRQVLEKTCVSSTRRNSYLVKRGAYVFAVSEVPLAEGAVGALHSFRVTDSGLEAVDTLSHLPPLLAHLWVNKAGTVVYTASYGTGEIMAIRVQDGKFGELLSYTRNSGSSINPKRQTCAHPHSLWLSPDERNLYLCDLGTDELLRFSVGEQGELLEKEALSVPTGYGPRHLVFSKDGKRAFVLTEMIWHLLEVDISGEKMVLTRDISLEGDIPRSSQGGGAIRLSADGKELYCSNRSKDHSCIAVLNADTLEVKETLTDCLWPRDFILTEDEKFLLCGNQTGDSISIFRKTEAGWEFYWKISDFPTPVCIVELDR